MHTPYIKLAMSVGQTTIENLYAIMFIIATAVNKGSAGVYITIKMDGFVVWLPLWIKLLNVLKRGLYPIMDPTALPTILATGYVDKLNAFFYQKHYYAVFRIFCVSYNTTHFVNYIKRTQVNDMQHHGLSCMNMK